MRKGLFTVLFMVLVTTVFISVLAYVNEISRDRIEKNQEIRRVRSVLYACAILPHGLSEEELSPTSTTADIPYDEEKIVLMLQERTTTLRLPVTEDQKQRLSNSFLSVRDSVEILVVFDEAGNVFGYGFDLKGKGLWGTISAFAVVSADLERMIGIDFTEQVETPGLGARITESGFKYYFRNLDLSGFHDVGRDGYAVQMVGKKEKSNVEEATNTVQAITGATQTCNGVLDMVNTDLSFYIDVLRQNKSSLEALNE